MLTYLLIAINVAVSLIVFSMMNRGGGSDVYLKGVFSPYEVSKGRHYPGLILSHFSHADGAHLLFYMVTLYLVRPDFPKAGSMPIPRLRGVHGVRH